jgi:hypothetical protein
VVDADGVSPRDFAGEAKSLACLLLEEQCGTVALLLSKAAQVATPACATGVPLAGCWHCKGCIQDRALVCLNLDMTEATDSGVGVLHTCSLVHACLIAPSTTQAIKVSYKLSSVWLGTFDLHLTQQLQNWYRYCCFWQWTDSLCATAAARSWGRGWWSDAQLMPAKQLPAVLPLCH